MPPTPASDADVIPWPKGFLPTSNVLFPFALWCHRPGWAALVLLTEPYGDGFFGHPVIMVGGAHQRMAVHVRAQDIVGRWSRPPPRKELADHATARRLLLDVQFGQPSPSGASIGTGRWMRGRPDGTTVDLGALERIIPTPEALAADPPPFQFLPMQGDGLYRLVKPQESGPPKVVSYSAHDLLRIGSTTRFYNHIAWLNRMFPMHGTYVWPDGEIGIRNNGPDWRSFALWIRDMCRAVPAGSEALTAMELAARIASPDSATGYGRTAPSDPPDHRGVTPGPHPGPGSDQRATCHAQSGTTLPPRSPPTGSAPPSPDRPAPAAASATAWHLPTLPAHSVPGSCHSVLEPSSSPSVVRTNDGEGPVPPAQADGAGDRPSPGDPTEAPAGTPAYPTPEALAADPPPYTFLPSPPGAQGLYRVIDEIGDGTPRLVTLSAVKIAFKFPVLGDLARDSHMPWLLRHFRADGQAEWVDGKVTPSPQVDWQRFAMWLRDQCEAARITGSTDRAAAVAKQSSHTLWPAGDTRATSLPVSPGPTPPRPMSPPLESTPLSPARSVLEPSSSPSVVRTNDGEGPVPPAQADGAGDRPSAGDFA